MRTVDRQESPVVLTRALFLGTGVYVACVGAILFFVQAVTLAPTSASGSTLLRWMTTDAAGQGRVINPPEWLPYMLVGMGGVTVLYAIALPKAAWKPE
jgi:hypothetical protein